MSDTENRGRVLFILMTNRPDRLEVDMKRPGRFDRRVTMRDGMLYDEDGTRLGSGDPAETTAPGPCK